MAYMRRAFNWWDAPQGRTLDSFAFKLEQIWSESVVDELYTDDRSERDRIVKEWMEQLYDVRVTSVEGETLHRAAREQP